jgi:hypothetical protein
MGERTSVIYGEGMKGMGIDIFISTRNISYTITSEVDVAANGNGVMVCQGGRFGGFSFYIKAGKPTFTYNYLGLQSYNIVSSQALKPGKHTIVYDFKYDGGGRGKGGMGTISIDGTKVGEGRIDFILRFFLPLEVFVHGALCVAYSGQCLTSESLGRRSANRGECAQACRMPYQIVVDGEVRDLGEKSYLLSPQDLAAIGEIPELMRLGVRGFKVEGRLKTRNTWPR